MTECIFYDASVEIVIFTTKNAMKSTKEQPPQDPTTEKQKNEVPRKRIANNALIVSQEGKSFDDTLKKIRTDLDSNSMAGKVNAIRKTENGEVLLVLQKGVEHDKLKEKNDGQ